MDQRSPVLIAVAPTGARRPRSDHPRLPITPVELAACAQECLAAGASMMHLHVRDNQGRHTLDPDLYGEAITAIRQRVGDDLVLQLTTESAGVYSPPQQMAAMEALRPEAVSIAVRELLGERGNEMDAASFLHTLAGRSTFVQYIVYDVHDMRRCIALHASGVIPQQRPYLLLVLGAYAEQRSGKPRDLLSLLSIVPEHWPWSTCAFGAAELHCVVAGALLGGDVRVGFENNLQLPWGETAANNAALVHAAVAALSPLGFRAATCAEARRRLRATCA